LRDALGSHAIDAVIHLAAKAGVRQSILDPAGYARANVLGTQSLLAEAERRGVRRIVFASSSSVYGNGAVVPFREDAVATEAVDRSARGPQESEIVNIGGNRPTSLRRLVELLSEALSVRPAIEQLPPQPGDVERTWADISKARRLLGYVPTTTIEDGIARFVD